MKKLNFLSILLSALLVSGSVWAEKPSMPNVPNVKDEPSAFQVSNGDVPQSVASRKAELPLKENSSVNEAAIGTTEYAKLAQAIAAVPKNSVATTITVLKNISDTFPNGLYTIEQYQNVVLELNGYEIKGLATNSGTSYMIYNKGTLTIQDNTDINNNGSGTGILTMYALNPDTIWSNGYPGWANNTMINDGMGTLIINSGTFTNTTDIYSKLHGYMGATYVLDSYSSSGEGGIVMNGGKLYNKYYTALRAFAQSEIYSNTITIKGGIIEANRPIWLQLPGSSSTFAPKVNFTMTGGTLKNISSSESIVLYSYSYGNSFENVNINISDGDFIGGYLCLSGGAKNGYEHVSISGGNFYYPYGMYVYGTVFPYHESVSGGWFLSWAYYGYDKSYDYALQRYNIGCASYVENEYEETWGTIGACYTDTTSKSGNWNDEKTWKSEETPDETTNVTISNNSIITVTKGDTAVANQLNIKGEGQIIVKDGATLEVGSGGIVSTNDVLTTIIVESGGTLKVGTDGVTKDGEALPVEIESTGEKSGIFLISPTATENTKPIATVTLKTNVYKKAPGKYRWQHFGIPTDGQPTSFDLGDNTLTHYIYTWDYDNDTWKEVTTLAQLNEPFRGYNLTNTGSAAGNVYTFTGNLVGVENAPINFSANGFNFFANSYTAPIDILTLLLRVEQDIQSTEKEGVELSVTVYDSKFNTYETVNKGALEDEETEYTSIAPMQGYFMNLRSGNTASTYVDYMQAVWSNPNITTDPLKAPKRQVAQDGSNKMSILVSADGDRDKVRLIENNKYSASFDNGYDATKYFNSMSYNIYASTTEGYLSRVSTDNLDETYLGFKANGNMSYQMTFENVSGDAYELKDLVANKVINIVEGVTYNFVASPNSNTAQRFQIVRKLPGTTTSVEETPITIEAKGIYTMMGKFVGETSSWDQLPQGVYVVDGTKLVK